MKVRSQFLDFGRVMIVFGLSLLVAALVSADCSSKDRIIASDRAYLGYRVKYQPMTETSGVLRVVEVFSGGAADRAGLLAGDLILAIDEAKVYFSDDLDQVLSMNKVKAGEAHSFLVARGKAEFEVEMIGDSLTPKMRSVLQEWVNRAQLQLTEFGTIICDAAAPADDHSAAQAWSALLNNVQNQGHATLKVRRTANQDLQIESKEVDFPPTLNVSVLPRSYQDAAEKLRTGDFFTFHLEFEGVEGSFSLTAGETPEYISLASGSSSSEEP